MVLGTEIALEANGWFFGASLVAGAVLTFGGVRLRSKLVSIERSQAEVNRQVNHVEDPENEATLRQIVCTTHETVAGLRADVAEQARHLRSIERRAASLEVAQLASQERLAEVGRLARATADALAALRGVED